MNFSRRQFLMAVSAGGLAIPAFADIQGIEIGVCRPAWELDNAIRYGFDYMEPPAAAVSAMSERGFRSFRANVLASPIRCECFNGFIRRQDLHVVGNDVRWDRLREYLNHTLARCRQLGGKIAVWGSARSRNVPLGYSRDKAMNQIQDFLRRAGEIASRYHIIIAVEPLRHEECNIINTGAEAFQLVHKVNHPNVKMTIDYYQLREEREDLDIIWKARKEIVHFHFANPHGRLWPKSPAEDSEYGQFFRLVKKIQYQGGISIDGRGTFARDAAASLAFFRDEITSA